MAKRKRSAGSKTDRTTSIVWMFFGLAIGLIVAAGVYVADRWEPAISEPTLASTAPSVTAEPGGEPIVEEESDPATRFEFYDLLPRFEVVLPEVESEARPDREAVSVAEPGSYVLQAGSFTEVADAERMRATLALLGLESHLQRVSIEDDIYHRVRIGPTSDLNKLNGYRRQLWDARIEVMLIKEQN
jgi:cell division protein FtsN